MFRTSSTPAASSSSGTTSSSEEDWGYIRHAVVESVFEEEEVSDLDLQPDVPLRRGSLFRSRVDSGGDGVFHLLTGTGQTDEDEDEDGEGETNSFLKDRKESSRWRRNSTEWVEEQKDRKREERKFSKGKDNRVLKGSTLQGEKQDGRDGGLVVVAEETMLPFHMQRETPEHRRARTISLYICVLTLLLDMVMFAIPLPSLALYLRHLEKGDIDIYSTGQLANPDNTYALVPPFFLLSLSPFHIFFSPCPVLCFPTFYHPVVAVIQVRSCSSSFSLNACVAFMALRLDRTLWDK